VQTHAAAGLSRPCCLAAAARFNVHTPLEFCLLLLLQHFTGFSKSRREQRRSAFYWLFKVSPRTAQVGVPLCVVGESHAPCYPASRCSSWLNSAYPSSHASAAPLRRRKRVRHPNVKNLVRLTCPQFTCSLFELTKVERNSDVTMRNFDCPGSR
jgi:hypothetical protein